MHVVVPICLPKSNKEVKPNKSPSVITGTVTKLLVNLFIPYFEALCEGSKLHGSSSNSLEGADGLSLLLNAGY